MNDLCCNYCGQSKLAESECDRLNSLNAGLVEALMECVERMPVNDPLYSRQLESAWAKARAALAKAKETT